MSSTRYRTALAIVFALTASATTAAAVVGEAHRTASSPTAALRDAEHRAQIRITVWYPAAEGAVAQPLVIGPPDDPMFRVGSVAPDAPFAADASGRRRAVILLSHGYGGTARLMGWFGTVMAEAGYMVVSVDHPGNNGVDPMTVAGAILWWERAEDLKRALDVIEADPILGPHIDRSHVGVAGFSAGGFTALLLGGARADPEHLMGFCRTHPQDGVCRPQLEFQVTESDLSKTLADPEIAVLEARAHDDHAVPTVKAVFAMAPALVQATDPASLRTLDKPVSIVAGSADTVAPPDSNARAAASSIPGAQLTIVPDVGHYALVARCTPAGVATAPVCRLTGPQDVAHRVAIEQARAFFARYLPELPN